MRIALNNLGSDKLDLDLGSDRIVELSELRNLGGTIERAGAVMQLRDISADGAMLQQLSLPLPTGKLSTATPAALQGIEANVDVRADNTAAVPAFTGLISGASLTSGAVSLELAVGSGTLKVSGNLAGSNINVAIHADRGEVHVESLDLRNVQLMIEGAIVRVDRLAASNLHVTWGGGHAVGVAVQAGELSNVHVRQGGSDFKLTNIVLPGGFSLANKTVTIDALNADTIDAIVAIVLGNKPETDRAAPPELPAPANPLVDMSVLDRLNGHVNVDVTLAAVVPVIGTRNATHKFRIPVNDGIIDYSEVEDDLSSLEDAFIDFAVRGNRLVIERDVPIIPGLNKPIVIWDLEADDLALAKRRLVRLRTLPNARLAAAKDANGKSAFKLKRLRAGNIDIALAVAALAEDAPEENTALRRISVGKLVVGGLVDHMPSTELEPTPVEIDAEKLGATINGLAVGKMQLGVSVHVGAIKGAILTMNGLKPAGLTGDVHDVRITGLRLSLP